MIGFDRKRSFNNKFDSTFMHLDGEVSPEHYERLKLIKKYWDFYRGYHWEEIPETDTPELTMNYCRAFVNKYVAFELGKAFTMSVHKSMEDLKVASDDRTLYEFLEDVWKTNKQHSLCAEFGQMKSVTGEAWIQVSYNSVGEFDDPFEEYPEGRMRLTLLPTHVVFPEYNPHDKDILERVTIMYSYVKKNYGIFGRPKEQTVVYKQVWTKESCTVTDGKEEPIVYANNYGIIPIVSIKNNTIAGEEDGVSDLEDVVPLNVELNMKESNISEIIDYHSAPVTVVYGAKIGNLEKGANKLWGGLAKDAKVENLELKSDLGASANFSEGLKQAMCEIGAVPKAVLGGSQAISNTSGVALQYMNLPLIEKTRVKRMYTENGIETLNKIIVLVALTEGLITRPPEIPARQFFYNEVTIPDTLPKDTLMELQQIQQEMTMGLESRRNAMKRMGKENIEALIAEIDKDQIEHPEYFAKEPNKFGEEKQINSGMSNGQTATEQLRTEMTGANG